MKQSMASQKEPGTGEKMLGILHHIGRSMEDSDPAAAIVGALAVVGVGALAPALALTPAVAAAVAALAAAALAAAAGSGLQHITEQHKNAVTQKTANKAKTSGKGIMAVFVLAAGLAVGNGAYNALEQAHPDRPQELPAAAAAHECWVSGGADGVLKKYFTPSAEGQQAGNDNIPYTLPGNCTVQSPAL